MAMRLAFVVVEDVLLDAARWECDIRLARFISLHASTPRERARRIVSRLADLPAYALSLGVSERLTDELAARTYAGFSFDRLAVLGELAAKEVLAPLVRPDAKTFLARLGAEGFRLVAFTALPEQVVAPLLASLGAIELAANRLTRLGVCASGEFAVPGTNAAERAARAREWAARLGASLGDASAWASRAADGDLLSAVGHPHVVNPDEALGKLAAERGWQVETAAPVRA
jgi:phosphoserine phosphatase